MVDPSNLTTSQKFTIVKMWDVHMVEGVGGEYTGTCQIAASWFEDFAATVCQ